MQTNSQVESDSGVLLARRRTQLFPDGAYLFEDDLAIEGEITATVITCTAWLLELYELQSGEFFLIRGTENVHPLTDRFGVLYAPFSICRPYYKNVKAHLVGIAATESLPRDFLAGPILFASAFNEIPTRAAQVTEILRAGSHRQWIEINPRPSLLSLKAKRLIDESYLAYPSITRVAQRLTVSPEHLSRQFKRDFGMSPSSYLRQLRVADAPLKLARGEEIVNVSHDVGYNDLSRFYKQFRKTTDTSPGECKDMMRVRDG